MTQEEDLSKVKVQIACCSKCGGVIKVSVSHRIDKKTAKEYSSLMLDGCDIKSTNVIVARTLPWCQEPCEGMWPKKEERKKVNIQILFVSLHHYKYKTRLL